MRTARKRRVTPSAGRTEHHELLDVAVDASLDDIKRAYRHLALEVHPDANPDDPAAEARFRQLNEAYETLAALAPDPPEEQADSTDQKCPVWNVFADQPPRDPSGTTGSAATGGGSTSPSAGADTRKTDSGAASATGPGDPVSVSEPRRIRSHVAGRTTPLIKLPQPVSDHLLRLLLVAHLVWAIAGLPGMFGRQIGDVGQSHALLCVVVGVVGWFVIGAALWSRAPVVPKELSAWRSPGWDGTALLIRLTTFFVLAHIATTLVLVAPLDRSDDTPPWPFLVWGALIVSLWIASARVPYSLGYQSRYERYWRMEGASLPPRTFRPRRTAPPPRA